MCLDSTGCSQVPLTRGRHNLEECRGVTSILQMRLPRLTGSTRHPRRMASKRRSEVPGQGSLLTTGPVPGRMPREAPPSCEPRS